MCLDFHGMSIIRGLFKYLEQDPYATSSAGSLDTPQVHTEYANLQLKRRPSTNQNGNIISSDMYVMMFLLYSLQKRTKSV